MRGGWGWGGVGHLFKFEWEGNGAGVGVGVYLSLSGRRMGWGGGLHAFEVGCLFKAGYSLEVGCLSTFAAFKMGT